MSMQALDTRILLFINHDIANALFDVLMPALSLKGYLLVTPFLLLMLIQAGRTKSPRGKSSFTTAIGVFLIACLAVYIVGYVEDWMKEAVGRVRPCHALEDIRLILPCPRSFSMPSGHAISSFAFSVPLFYLTRKFMALSWRMYPVVLAALIAFSRIYLGVHYPTDVLIGGMLGASIGLTLSILYLAAGTHFLKNAGKS